MGALYPDEDFGNLAGGLTDSLDDGAKVFIVETSNAEESTILGDVQRWLAVYTAPLEDLQACSACLYYQPKRMWSQDRWRLMTETSCWQFWYCNHPDVRWTNALKEHGAVHCPKISRGEGPCDSCC